MTEMRTLAWLCVTTALAGACGPGAATTKEDPTEDGSSTEAADTTSDLPTDDTAPTDPTVPTTPTEADTDTGDDTTEGATTVDPNTVALAENNQVDILFVLDNSGSMAEEQARLASDIAALMNTLDGVDWRVGMTTTDAGNPRCQGTTPENGRLVLSSCLDRVAAGDFMASDIDFSEACTALCAKADGELVVTPTTTHLDTNPAPRRWVERTAGQLNIEGVDSAVEALQCYLPQGVAGCGFESHLESMFRALAGSKAPSDGPNAGFVRDTAALAVVMVSDETDCSFDPDHDEIFTVNKVFWEDPQAAAPTSAMCWRAGVRCVGAGPTFETCVAENWDEQGNPGASDDDAVLQPVSQYVAFLNQIEGEKQLFNVDAQVLTALITGVPIGYEDFSSEIEYAEALDPGFQSAFGIGPGCIAGPANDPSATAVPPVREREWAEVFATGEGRNLYSVCESSYAATLASIGEQIRGQIVPLCMPNCVADVDPATPIVDPNCQVFEEDLAAETRVEVAACALIDGAWVVPAGQTICFAELVDKGGETPSAIDDMDPRCVDDGFNLEFKVVRTQAKQPGTVLSAACELSQDKAMDCPNL